MSSSSPPLTPPTSDSENEPSTFDDEYRGYASVPSTQSHARILHLAASSPHPFAASTKANRAPPSYEKRPFTPPATPLDPQNKIQSVRIRAYQCPDSYNLRGPPFRDESEQSLWDNTLSSCIDGAKGKVDLSGNNLTFIPPSIIDLRNLVVLPEITRDPEKSELAPPRSFRRSATAPAFLQSAQHSGTRHRQHLPTVTTNNLDFVPGLQRKRNESRSKCEIELYLMRNTIRALPRELFALDCLVVLSLRQNKLTSLPPAIGQLTRLRELNVASNRLTYLPSEILKLRLTTLHLHPNPFIPSHTADTKCTRKFGPLSRGSPVPALSETVLRLLLSPANAKTRSPTRLEASMTQPLDGLLLPNHFLRIIRASTGHGVASQKGIDAEEDVTANVCPNSRHMRAGVFRGTATNGTFCTPVETVMEWVGVVAGVQVAESPPAWVPVLWRGCSNGCLAYMAPEGSVDEKEGVHGMPAFAAGTGKEGELFEFSDDEQ